MEPGYNDYSKELLSHFPVIDKAKNEVLKFQVSGVYFDKLMNRLIVPTSVSIRVVDRIYDPGHKKEIDIAYIIGKRPLGPNSPRAEETILGEISFTRGNFGMFEWDGNRAQEGLAMYLFFSNSNGSNVDKPWYKEGTIQYKIIGDEGASVQLTAALLVDKAKAKIATFDESFLETIKYAWFPQDADRLTREQLMLRIRSVAERDPNKILSLTPTGGEVSMDAAVNIFVKSGLIKLNDINTEWLFKDGTPLVPVKGDEAPAQSIKRFFATEVGKRVYAALDEETMAAG